MILYDRKGFGPWLFSAVWQTAFAVISAPAMITMATITEAFKPLHEMDQERAVKLKDIYRVVDNQILEHRRSQTTDYSYQGQAPEDALRTHQDNEPAAPVVWPQGEPDNNQRGHAPNAPEIEVHRHDNPPEPPPDNANAPPAAIAPAPDPPDDVVEQPQARARRNFALLRGRRQAPAPPVPIELQEDLRVHPLAAPIERVQANPAIIHHENGHPNGPDGNPLRPQDEIIGLGFGFGLGLDNAEYDHLQLGPEGQRPLPFRAAPNYNNREPPRD